VTSNTSLLGKSNTHAVPVIIFCICKHRTLILKCLLSLIPKDEIEEENFKKQLCNSDHAHEGVLHHAKAKHFECSTCVQNLAILASAVPEI